jgi:hypothetical protein
MRIVTFSVFILISYFAVAQEDEAYVDLFNGKNLDGWEYFLSEPGYSMEDVWSVSDGLLICKGEPMGYIATKDLFTNYKLVVEWRWAPGKPAGNSGVLMRIAGEPKALPKCYEAQLRHRSAGDVYGFHGYSVSGDSTRFRSAESELAGKMTGVSKMRDNEDEAGDWNQYEIYMLGGNITVYVNGTKVNEAYGLEIAAGKIGMQSEGGEIQFRTVKILPVD